MTTSRRIRRADTALPFDIGLYVAEIDLDTGRSISPSVLIRSASRGDRSGTVEGSHIHKRDGLYYLFAAEGGTEAGHCATICRSKNVFGPYAEPPRGVNPIVHNGDHPDIQSVGHMDIVRVNGTNTWLAVFLGIRPTRRSDTERPEWSTTGHLGRESFAAGMVWTANGWPEVNHGKPIELICDYPGVPTTVRVAKSWREEFVDSGESILAWVHLNGATITFLSLPVLPRNWYTIRTPLKPFWAVSPSNGLSIWGNVHRLDWYQESPACLLVRQKDRLAEFTADMARFVDIEHVGQEAGVTLWISKSNHASLGVRLLRDDQDQPMRQLVFRKPDESSGDPKRYVSAHVDCQTE